MLVIALMISGYGPRPVAFASTISKDGIDNLSPFSYTTMLNHDPPVVVIGFSPYIKVPLPSLPIALSLNSVK